MSENDFGSSHPDHAGGSRFAGAADGSAGWPRPRWRRGGSDRGQENATPPPAPAPAPAPAPDESASTADASQTPSAQETPETVIPHTTNTTVGQAGSVAIAGGDIHKVEIRKEVRKRDVLDGVERDREEILDQPFVLEAQWGEAWDLAADPSTGRLRQRILIVVAPRSYGSTTFALQLLARHADAGTTLVKLDADWRAPSRGRLPLDRQRAYQVDLKDKTTDQISADFVESLAKHAEDLEENRSYLVLTVAKELWHDHYLPPRGAIQIVHLKEPPDPLRVVLGHLEFRGYSHLAPGIQSLGEARASLSGLDAVEAVGAALKTISVWEEYNRQQADSPLAARGGPQSESSVSFADQLTAALSDWREKLDSLFGEVAAVHGEQDTSLTLEDRCLLLALAVRQSAPMAEVADTASKLQNLVTTPKHGKSDTASLAQAVFAGRGLRRRIHDVGARVDAHDTVLFDQPSYGRAILSYVWDNYQVMREPLLSWLTQAGGATVSAPPVVDALSDLVLRHGSAEPLDTLGPIARGENSELLGSVMLNAVKDEHVGRLAWATLYRWAEQSDYTSTVISTCRRVLQDPSTSQSAAKMAMVRLRRIVHKIDGPTTRPEILKVYRDLAEKPDGVEMLVAEVAAWQASKGPQKSGSLAFKALMSKDHDGMPWLMSDAAARIEVDQALQTLLSEATTAHEIIPHLTDWIRTYATDADNYVRLRDRLVRVLRGHDMFQAYWDFMQALASAPITVQGINVAQDFHQHLVDPRLQRVFPLEGDPA